MKELAYSYIEFGEEYWWAFLIIWLLWIIVAHIPNFIDFHYADIIIPSILLAIWGILKLLVAFSVIKWKDYNNKIINNHFKFIYI